MKLLKELYVVWTNLKLIVWGIFETSIEAPICDLPDREMYIIAALTQVSIVVTFLYFLITGFLSGIDSTFLAPVGNSFDLCSPVLRPVPTNTYLADANGAWEGQIKYKTYLSKYKFFLNNLRTGNEDYAVAMREINDEFIGPYLVEPSRHRNLAQNMVQWMGWRIRYGLETFNQFISLNGNPFDILVPTTVTGGVQGYIVSDQGTCNIFRPSTDRANFRISLEASRTVYEADTNCTEILNINTFTFSGDSISISLDVRSFATTMAIADNLIFSVPSCAWTFSQKSPCLIYTREISTTFLSNSNKSQELVIYGVQDPLQPPGSLESFCVQTGISSQNLPVHNCAFATGRTFAVPVFNHMGYNLEKPSYCDCSLTEGNSMECNQFNFFVGLLLYDTSDVSLYNWNDPVLRLMTRYSPSELNRLAYNIMFPNANSSENDRFEFCRDPILNITCRAIVFQLLGLDESFVNEHLYSIGNASCADSFSNPNWNVIVENPPVSLTEEYVICTKEGWDAFFSAFGIAVGNSTIPGLLAVLLAYGILSYRQSTEKRFDKSRPAQKVIHTTTSEVLKHPQSRKFTAKEKEKIIDLLSNNLLKIVQELRDCGNRDMDITITENSEILRRVLEVCSNSDAEKLTEVSDVEIRSVDVRDMLSVSNPVAAGVEADPNKKKHYVPGLM